jgi:hypothetical protein
MPLEPNHIYNYLRNPTNEKINLELIDFLIKRINKLCFEECQIDRIQCTLNPLCKKRFLLKLRIKNGLPLEDLPMFCYSVHKNIVMREYRNKNVIYKPMDAYLYLIDFLDIYFHGDYRKLNKALSLKNWDDALKIFEDRISSSKENFQYYLKDNYMLFKFEDRIHIIFLNEKYVLCNAHREQIVSLELLNALCKFFGEIYFPEGKVKLIQSEAVEITITLPTDVIKKISKTIVVEENPSSHDYYFWNKFHEDLGIMTQYCKEIKLELDRMDNLLVKFYIDLKINNVNDQKEQLYMRYKDLGLLLKYVDKLYNEFYVIWLK